MSIVTDTTQFKHLKKHMFKLVDINYTKEMARNLNHSLRLWMKTVFFGECPEYGLYAQYVFSILS